MKDQSPSQLSPWRRTLLFLRRSTRSGALRVDYRFATVRVASSLVFLLATSLIDLQHFRPTLAKGLEQNQEVRGPSLHSAEFPDGSNAPRAQLRGEQAQSYHLATGIAIASRIQTADSASGAESPGHSLAITLAPNERIRIPVGLEGGISAWKLCLEVDGWWQVLQVEIFEGRREPEASSKPASSNAPGFTSISDRQWRPRLDELVNTLHGGPVAARHFTREIFFISNRSEAYLELTNRSQSQTVNIARVYALPIPVRSEANSAQEPPHPLQDALITEYLSTDDSLRLLAASRRLEKRLSEKPSSGNQASEINASDATQQLQSAIQSWLQYAKDRGVTCLSVPVVFRRGSLYASEHVFKRPLGNVPHSPDTLITDEQVVERFPSIDLVEQLYRACHSTGILFCPAIDLSFPISELEPLSSKVVETPYRNPKIPAQASAWNPQSQTVHQALTELLQELPKRYGALPGYCGFSVTVDPNSAWWMELDTEAMHPELIAEASLGDHGYHQVRVSASAPLIADLAALRISVADTHRAGVLVNRYDGRKAQDYDNFTARAQLLITPDPDVKIRLIGDYAKQTQHASLTLIDGYYTTYANGAPIANAIFDRAARLNYTLPTTNAFARVGDANSPFRAYMESYGASGQIDWDLGPASLTAITAYRWWDWDPANDVDGTSLAINTKAQQVNYQRQFSQELRLASNGRNTVDYPVGLY